MESAVHQNLKQAALAWLCDQVGCAAAAREVRCPLARYVLDAAGYLDARPARAPHPARWFSPLRGGEHRTIIIECKASRSDYLSDCALLPELAVRRRRICEQLAAVREHYVHTLEPHLRASGNLLFADMESWEYGASTLHAHRTLVRQLRRVDLQLHGSTKFFLLAQYRLASMLFLLAPAGMLSPGEVPSGWGLLELAGGEVRTAIPAPILDSPEQRRHRLLRNIAAALTRRTEDPPRQDPQSTAHAAGTAAPAPAPTGT